MHMYVTFIFREPHGDEIDVVHKSQIKSLLEILKKIFQ